MDDMYAPKAGNFPRVARSEREMTRLPGQLPPWLHASRLACLGYAGGILVCLVPWALYVPERAPRGAGFLVEPAVVAVLLVAASSLALARARTAGGAVLASIAGAAGAFVAAAFAVRGGALETVMLGG